MSRNANGRLPQASPGKKTTAPSPPQVPHSTVHNKTNFETNTGGNVDSPMMTNRVWPAGSIPRTVKKLSWDDESDSPNSSSKVGTLYFGKRIFFDILILFRNSSSCLGVRGH